MSTIDKRIKLAYHGEISDSATRGVWLTRDPITPEEYEALVMPEGWISRHMTAETDLVLDIAYPARVAIFFNGDILHGSVRLDVPSRTPHAN